jgi:putative peptidoglycan lipid II flippase
MLGGLTLVSRVTGLLRDVVIGALFGASEAADAFFVAFRIPNLFRRVVAEGASSTAFVPVFTSYREREGSQEALRAAGAVGAAAAVLLAILVLLGSLLSEEIVIVFAPGFAADPDKLGLTTRLTAELFPYLWLVGMAAWAMGALHTFRRFAEPAYGPILLNLAIVGAVLVFAPRLPRPVLALTIGVLVGGTLQFVVQLPALRRLGMRPSHTLNLRHPAVRRVGALLVPTLIGGAVYQINIIVATMFASMLPDRSVSYLWYADRLFEFPLGMVAVAVGTAALPSLASHASRARYKEMSQATRHALQLVWSLCIPATAGLWLLAEPLVSVLFERGEFTGLDSVMTARALRAYTVGLFGVASIRVLVSVFYALERPRVPVAAAVVSLVINALCDLSLMGPVTTSASSPPARAIAELSTRLSVADLDHVGLALGTSIAATVNALLLLLFAERSLRGLVSAALVRSAGRHLIATALMAAGLVAWSRLTEAVEAAPLVELTGGLAIGSLVYVVAAVALGSEEVRDVLGSLRRRQKS